MREEDRLVEIWLTNAEKKDMALRDRLKAFYEYYGRKQYTVAVFESGERELYSGTLELLIYNRRRCAQREARRARQTMGVGG